MPLKFLKKSRQYDVFSKDNNIFTIVCLDGSNIDCTISLETKGFECLENVCQRIGILQNEFFGLRYYPKGVSDDSEMRWIDLQRPISRELEKYAPNTKVLYLRVMFYVISGVSLIHDEATRNYYFLQLRQDVVEGRISCDPKQAVILANYCYICEYGDFQDRHQSVDYLKSFLSFPKHFVESGMLEALTQEVIQQHHRDKVQDISQAAAEEFYISLCQQLDGYGQETFNARNDNSIEVMLGISVSGIIVAHSGKHKFYPWREIQNVVNHKRNFNIETAEANVKFVLEDADSGRYIWKLCISQHTFFMNYEQNHVGQVSSLFRNSTASKEDLMISDDRLCTASMYNSSSNLGSNNNNNNNHFIRVTSSESILDRVESKKSLQMSNSSQWNINNGSQHSLVNRAQSSIDLANSSSGVKDHLRSLLPSYRPAPSYEAVMMEKSMPDSSNSRLSSTSTPNLAFPTHHRIGVMGIHPRGVGSSPDLVSSRNILQPSHCFPMHANSEIFAANPSSFFVTNKHCTYENLNQIEITSRHQQAIYPLPHNIPSNLMVYPKMSTTDQSALLKQYQQQQRRNSHNVMREANFFGLSEPIYENFPMQSESEKQQRPQPHQLAKSSSSVNNLSSSSSNGGVKPTSSSSIQSSHRRVIEIEPAAATMMLTSNDEVKKLPSNKATAPAIPHQPGATNMMVMQKDVNLNNIKIPSQPELRAIRPESLNEHKKVFSESLSTTTTSSSSAAAHELSSVDMTDHSRMKAGTSQGRSKEEKKHGKIWDFLSGGGKPLKYFSRSGGGGAVDKKKTKSAELNNSHSQQNSSLRSNQKLQPLSPSISKENLCQILEMKLNDPELYYEFDRISSRERDNVPCTCALLMENRNKNEENTRNLPMDENRVKLTPSRVNRFGYVNASHVTSIVGQKQLFYIAAQTPFDSITAQIFWQSVWEADVYFIIQLSDEFSYIPKTSERCFEYGEYQIWLEFAQETNEMTTSKLRINHTQSRRYRSVWHICWNDFDDQMCPKYVSGFLEFLKEISTIRIASTSEIPHGHNRNPPVLLHCRGGEKTGLVLVADLLLYTLDHNQDIDIPRVIGQLREQRNKIVPSFVQYKFIYSLLIYYLRQTRLI